MKHSRILIGAILSSALLAACGGNNTGPSTGSFVPPGVANAQLFQGVAPDSRLSHLSVSRIAPFIVTPLSGVSEAELAIDCAQGKTIPCFTDFIKSRLGGKYEYHIMGKNPRKSDGTTYIPYVPIMLVITYPDGTVLDPTKPACGDSVSVEDRFLKGPNLVPTDMISNGVDVGKVQLSDAQQRAEFWRVLKGPGYHIVLQAAKAPIVVHIKAPSTAYTQGGVCSGASHRVGYFPLEPFLKLTVTLSEKYANPAQVPIILDYNTLQVLPSGCCAAGDHGAFKRPSGIQTWIYAIYNDAGAVPGFPTVADIAAATHEIGELFNDPFAAPVGSGGGNLTPAWGHVGQLPYGCSNYLEVGDPLSHNDYALKDGGFTYHPQELAFFSWFFRKKSIGSGGKYSFKGTFTTTQPLCV